MRGRAHRLVSRQGSMMCQETVLFFKICLF